MVAGPSRFLDGAAGSWTALPVPGRRCPIPGRRCRFLDGAARFLDGAARFLDGAARFLDGAARFLDGAARFLDGAARFLDGGETAREALVLRNNVIGLLLSRMSVVHAAAQLARTTEGSRPLLPVGRRPLEPEIKRRQVFSLVSEQSQA
ncbi:MULTISPECIES: hypothetical protein [Sorangium]|uniref:Uncharacterized protein n=1 Tax=Sorangium cellulosum TaxID=56 RepID=A0A4P2R5Y8_SORCE|nr:MULTISPECIES: hypothetical protein [Sorangium]AUX38091.1 uncharacterized protein SOCE836_103310 [Sorangium cellulosum]WCQ97379.1 hypothetical protein NQZ70_10173 [Sorangium sp. Soce836]